MQFITKYGFIILIVITTLALMNGCGSNVKINNLNKRIDSLNNRIVTQEQMINLIKTTPAIETLRLQDLSNKKNTPTINIYGDKKK